MNNLFFLTGGVVLAASLAAGGIFLYGRRKDLPFFKSGMPHTDKETPSGYSTEELSMVAEGIKKYSAEFDGLYEALFQAAQNRQIFSTEAYEEWCDRVGQSDDEAFRNAFECMFAKADIEDETRCREKYSRLLDCIAMAGITRDRDIGTQCVADETMHRFYIVTDGQKPVTGATYTVIKSAWINDTKVIEYGTVIPGTINI